MSSYDPQREHAHSFWLNYEALGTKLRSIIHDVTVCTQNAVWAKLKPPVYFILLNLMYVVT